MKLQVKLHIMITLLVVVIVIGMYIVFIFQSRDSMEQQMAISTSDMAYTVSQKEDIAYHLSEKNMAYEIQNILLPLMENTHFYYIIVVDMEAIQYSYPYESGLYKVYKNGGEEDLLQNGKQYVSVDSNELISAVRAFAPIYYEDQQVGGVIVGLLTDTIQTANNQVRQRTEYALLIGILLSIVIAYFLTINIKRSIFDLEPKEIALLLTQKELVFNNLELGILVVNNDGTIGSSNHKALQILDLEDNIEGTPLDVISKRIQQKFEKVLMDQTNLINRSTVLNNGTKVMVNMCILYDANQENFGVIISMEELTMVRKLAEELTGYKEMVESLRAQNHEFMNKLQVLSGLIQLEKYDKASGFIEEQIEMKHEINNIAELIHDDLILGLVLSKYELITEKKIDFYIDQESEVDGFPAGVRPEDICTIIANLLDNSMEAILEQDEKWITLFIQSSHDYLEIVVSNNSPDIEDDHIFNKGFSTKGDNRGYGLYNVKRIVEDFEGRIYYHNEKGVHWHVEK